MFNLNGNVFVALIVVAGCGSKVKNKLLGANITNGGCILVNRCAVSKSDAPSTGGGFGKLNCIGNELAITINYRLRELNGVFINLGRNDNGCSYFCFFVSGTFGKRNNNNVCTCIGNTFKQGAVFKGVFKNAVVGSRYVCDRESLAFLVGVFVNFFYIINGSGRLLNFYLNFSLFDIVVFGVVGSKGNFIEIASDRFKSLVGIIPSISFGKFNIRKLKSCRPNDSENLFKVGYGVNLFDGERNLFGCRRVVLIYKNSVVSVFERQRDCIGTGILIGCISKYNEVFANGAVQICDNEINVVLFAIVVKDSIANNFNLHRLGNYRDFNLGSDFLKSTTGRNKDSSKCMFAYIPYFDPRGFPNPFTVGVRRKLNRAKQIAISSDLDYGGWISNTVKRSLLNSDCALFYLKLNAGVGCLCSNLMFANHNGIRVNNGKTDEFNDFFFTHVPPWGKLRLP